MSHDVLSTERLTLRPPRAADAQAIFDNYASDPEVTRYLQWPPHHEVEGVRAFLRDNAENQGAGKALNWAITETAVDSVIGMITLRLESAVRAELGYVLARAYWGRGYMPEAASRVIALGLGPLNRFRVYAYTDFENLQSARVLEKSGMKREGLLHRYAVHPNLSPDPRDALMYASWR
jgi:RimJ/RimL family protein N-acetyltransferase